MELIINILNEIIEDIIKNNESPFTVVDKDGNVIFKADCCNESNENNEPCCDCENCDYDCEDEDLSINNVIFSGPATIVLWSDGSKTVVKTQNNEPFDKEKGLAMAIIKRMTGNTGGYNEIVKEWCVNAE